GPASGILLIENCPRGSKYATAAGGVTAAGFRSIVPPDRASFSTTHCLVRHRAWRRAEPGTRRAGRARVGGVPPHAAGRGCGGGGAPPRAAGGGWGGRGRL